LVHRRYLNRSRYIKGWVGWGAKPPFDAELVLIDGREERRVPVKDIPIRLSHLALLADCRFLLVSGRTSRITADEDTWRANALVFSPLGSPEGEFCIGDDIPALVTDRSGGIWTAYGDEGIYGGHPESGGGLAGWTPEGRAMWLPQGRLPDVPLEGLTAATEDDGVWLLWYSGGSRAGTYLTRVTPSTSEVTSYPSPVPKPDGFAIRGNYAVFTVRDHNRRSTELIHAELDGATWTITGRRKLRVPGRVVMHCGQGRDGSLWLRTGDTWLRIEA
jgi:hypothetical protein